MTIRRLEEGSLQCEPSGRVSAQTLAHPVGGMQGGLSLLAAVAISGGHMDAPLGVGPGLGWDSPYWFSCTGPR